MSCRVVSVLVRAGEVVVVLDSVEELAEVLGEVERRRSVVGPVAPKPAAGDRRPVVAGSVAVPFGVWAALRSVVSQAEGIIRESAGGRSVGRRDLYRWLADVEDVRRVWSQPGSGGVSDQAGDA